MGLLEKLKNKQAIIGIVGLGYVGLPLMLRYATVGYKVVGIDVDPQKISDLSQSKSYILHIPDEKIARVAYNIKVTTDFSAAMEVDALILCVPTPLNKYREPDLSYVISSIEKLLPYLHENQVVSLESTTYPGTTEEELMPRIESKGFKVGKDIYLLYSPEREDPGNVDFGTADIPKVCGGITSGCLEIGVALYEQVVARVVQVTSTKAAEMTKLLENIHRSVNIGLMNEMKIVADKMGLDMFEVIYAAATKPFGFVPYYPGPGIGGHCIPIDPFYLTWKSREFGLHTRFIELAGEINSSMPQWVVDKTIDALNSKGKALKGSKVLTLGVAYKKNIEDMRESPSLIIMELLQEKGAIISYSDPYVAQIYDLKAHHLTNLESVNFDASIIKEYDCVIIATAHDLFDYELIKEHAMLIVDTRGVYHRENLEKIVRA